MPNAISKERVSRAAWEPTLDGRKRAFSKRTRACRDARFKNTSVSKWVFGPLLLGPDSGRTDFSRIFIFEPPDFFADFVAGFFLLIFVGKSAQKNPPGKSPAKSSKFYTTKIPDTFLQRGRANF